MSSEFDPDELDDSEQKSIIPNNRENLETVIWGVAIAIAVFVAFWMILRMFMNSDGTIDILSAMNSEDNIIAAQ